MLGAFDVLAFKLRSAARRLAMPSSANLVNASLDIPDTAPNEPPETPTALPGMARCFLVGGGTPRVGFPNLILGMALIPPGKAAPPPTPAAAAALDNDPIGGGPLNTFGGPDPMALRVGLRPLPAPLLVPFVFSPSGG